MWTDIVQAPLNIDVHRRPFDIRLQHAYWRRSPRPSDHTEEQSSAEYACKLLATDADSKVNRLPLFFGARETLTSTIRTFSKSEPPQSHPMSSSVDSSLAPLLPSFTSSNQAESTATQSILHHLNLQPHPEGGYFVETDRDSLRVPNPQPPCSPDLPP